MRCSCKGQPGTVLERTREALVGARGACGRLAGSGGLRGVRQVLSQAFPAGTIYLLARVKVGRGARPAILDRSPMRCGCYYPPTSTPVRVTSAAQGTAGITLLLLFPDRSTGGAHERSWMPACVPVCNAVCAIRNGLSCRTTPSHPENNCHVGSVAHNTVGWTSYCHDTACQPPPYSFMPSQGPYHWHALHGLSTRCSTCKSPSHVPEPTVQDGASCGYGCVLLALGRWELSHTQRLVSAESESQLLRAAVLPGGPGAAAHGRAQTACGTMIDVHVWGTRPRHGNRAWKQGNCSQAIHTAVQASV